VDLPADEGANTGIADPQHSPEIRFSFQLRWFREFGARAMKQNTISSFQLSRLAFDDIMVLMITYLTQDR
jgi:hypothetical protein